MAAPSHSHPTRQKVDLLHRDDGNDCDGIPKSEIRNPKSPEFSQAPLSPEFQRIETQYSKLKTQNSCDEGYTLVVLVMIIAVMAIMMAVAVQIVSFQMKREREAELIFRGKQYVEAIRLYKQKYGRNPMQMKELWEADPRVLRQRWIDPITNSDKWGLVFMGQGQRVSQAGQGPRGQAPTPTRTPVFSEREGAFGETTGEKVGPIIGVHSRSTDESIKIYEGRTRYNEWLFVLEDQGAATTPGGGGDNEKPWGQPPTPIPGQSPIPTPRRTGTPNY